MGGTPTRRVFLGNLAQGVAALGGVGVMARRSRAGAFPANEKLALGFVGLDNQGRCNLGRLAEEKAVALCDVDDGAAERARSQHPDARFYKDFRRMLDQKDIQAVVVSTPDHTHAVATMAALKAGKHVYCEKPLTHTLHEARQVTTTARLTGRVTQMGIQVHAADNYRRVVELIRAGAIGEVRDVHVWASGAHSGGDRPKDTPRVPKGLDYDLWLGPAPYRPYHPAYLPRKWRGWWDFGGGMLADYGCHLMDLVHWSLGLTHPTRIEAEGPPVHPESPPSWLKVRWAYVREGGSGPVRVTWYDGGKRPEVMDRLVAKGWHRRGVLFAGEKGYLLADYERRLLLPEQRFADFEPPTPTIPESIGHHAEWVRACKGAAPPSCSFAYSGPLTEAVLLGIVAYRVGKPVEWDGKTGRVTNCPKAERFNNRPTETVGLCDSM